ncbi:MAG: hypothetical protein AB2A00_30895, partial [Myxococcota bacterium]
MLRPAEGISFTVLSTGCAPADEGLPCDDGLDCTINDRCAMGTCAGTSRSCDDSNPCTTGTCIEDPW